MHDSTKPSFRCGSAWAMLVGIAWHSNNPALKKASGRLQPCNLIPLITLTFFVPFQAQPKQLEASETHFDIETDSPQGEGG